MTEDLNTIIEAAAQRLMPLCPNGCGIGMILGSGLGAYAERLENARTLSYADIPGFPVSHVPGHAGRFVVGERYGKTVIAMQGRFHYYEGYPPALLALGVRVMRRLGVEKLLVTNAAGGVNLSYQPGTLMAIADHINFARVNPLIGPTASAPDFRIRGTPMIGNCERRCSRPPRKPAWRSARAFT